MPEYRVIFMFGLPNGGRLTCAAKRTLQLKEYNQFPCRTIGKRLRSPTPPPHTRRQVQPHVRQPPLYRKVANPIPNVVVRVCASVSRSYCIWITRALRGLTNNLRPP